ncbi:MAG: SDR family oxidoreductase [Planctomycetes bacterium]|nr:SDR family oxidoreductase [Planctomycetota bacterium]MCH8965313.1 SDR family oxidoreductase [Planctomycetota bacterium]
MRYVVAGAAGFIGSHLCERLLADGHEVVGIDNLITGQRLNLDVLRARSSFQFVEQDICSPLAVDGPVDVVFDFACPASPIDFEPKALDILRVCSAGVLNALSLAREKDAVFVQASTSECYGDPEEHPQRETYWGNVNPIGLRSPYDEGKRFAEALIMAHHRCLGIQTRIGRIFNTYGPRMRLDDGRVLPNFIQQALEGAPLTVFGDGSQTRSFCYVDDLVDGFVRLSRCDEVTPINIGNDIEITIEQLAQEVIKLTGSTSRIEYRDLPQDDPKLRCPDITKARRVLDWKPKTDRTAGLKSTIEYFRTVLATRPA